MRGDCPDDQALSEFLDGELAEESAVSIRSHVSGCQPCAAFLQIIALMPEVGAPEDEPLACTTGPRPEELVAYLAGVADAEDDIEQHLLGCQQCVRTLMTMQRRQRVTLDLSVSVPAAVQAAVTVKGGQAQPSRAGVVQDLLQAGWVAVSDWLSALTRLPVLVPASFAAGALVVFLAQQMSPIPGVQHRVTRSVPTQRTLSVTAPQAPLRAEPYSRAVTVATLHRGAVVEVVGEQDGWYRVLTREGSKGWVDRRAFQ